MTNPFDCIADHTARYFIHRGIDCMTQMGPFTINGYIELPENHPWLNEGDLHYFTGVDVHGGITYHEGRVIGFDTNHLGDRPHPDSPAVQQGLVGTLEEWDYVTGMPSRVWTQAMVVDETKNFAHQAVLAQQ